MRGPPGRAGWWAWLDDAGAGMRPHAPSQVRACPSSVPGSYPLALVDPGCRPPKQAGRRGRGAGLPRRGLCRRSHQPRRGGLAGRARGAARRLSRRGTLLSGGGAGAAARGGWAGRGGGGRKGPRRPTAWPCCRLRSCHQPLHLPMLPPLRLPQPKWPLMVAGCLRRVGRLEEALLKYREVRRAGCERGGAQVGWPLNRHKSAGCVHSPTDHPPGAGVRHVAHQHRGAALPGTAEPGE